MDTIWTSVVNAVSNVIGGAFSTAQTKEIEKTTRNADDQNGTTARKFAGMLPVALLFCVVIILITKK